MDRVAIYYGNYMSPELLESFEQIRRTEMMSVIRSLLQASVTVNFDKQIMILFISSIRLEKS